MNPLRTIAIGFLGPTLDAGFGAKRWDRWRPTVALCQQEDLLIDQLELLYDPRWTRLRDTIIDDISNVSPETVVVPREMSFDDPWEFEEVFAKLHDFAVDYPFDVEANRYLLHITTGTHVAQICQFLLAEARYIPAQLIQTNPPGKKDSDIVGRYAIIDLDLSKYDQIASRFQTRIEDDLSFLKSGIETRNEQFNRLIERIEEVAIRSKEPILLVGPTGAGKSRLAKRIYELKNERYGFSGRFVEVNCATLRGDSAMSMLFGHRRGAFTGAVESREGLLRAADGGALFLDEVADLGLDEQTMLLRAIEDKTFLPLGADAEVRSDFQLVCGTNRDLAAAVRAGTFREDLLARINLWTFALPGLRDRIDDIEPNLEYEMARFERDHGQQVVFNKEAKRRFLTFASSPQAAWVGNFRDLGGAVTRMATLARGGRITVETAEEEIERLRRAWQPHYDNLYPLVIATLGKRAAQELDRFDLVQLEDVLMVCKRHPNLSAAGRALFSKSRERRQSVNDADRLRKYLARFGVRWEDL